MGSDDRSSHRGLRTLLALGYLLLAWAILAAWADPASGYEVSIYHATTLGFWIGAGVALLVAVGTMIYAGRGRLAGLGILLAGMAVTAIVGLPVIRGYRFHGLADPMTHLGWAQSIRAGEMSAFELIYPANHVQAVMIGELGGLSTSRSMLLVVLAALVAYFVFVPLTIRVLVPDQIAVAIAAVSAFLLLPLNTIGTHRLFHPYTLATLMFPFFLYLLFKHGNGDAEDGSLPSALSAASLALPLVSAALVFIHPQTALNVLIFITTIAAVQFAYRRLRPNHPISRYRAIYGQVAFLSVLFFAWNLQFWQTFRLLDGLVTAIVATVVGTGTAGNIVAERTASASQIGVSTEELFVKLFLVSSVYVVLSVGLVGAKLIRVLRRDHPDNHVAIAYFTFSGFTLGPFFLAHYLGDISHYFFRHLGFAMVFVTLLGALGIFVVLRPFTGTGRDLLRPVAVVLVIVTLVLSLAVVYQSPYLYKRNHHVSDQLFDGYGETFANAPPASTDSEVAMPFVSIRTGPGRYADAHGVTDINGGGIVNESVLESELVDHYAAHPGSDGDYYLPISRMSRVSEVRAYRSLRYSRSSFEGVRSQRGVHRVQANGGYSLYYIDTSFASPDEAATGAG